MKTKIPEPCVRVVHASGAWLKSPAVSPQGVVAEGASDISRMGLTRDISEASAWPVSRALVVAKMLDGAWVDGVDVRLDGTFNPQTGA